MIYLWCQGRRAVIKRYFRLLSRVLTFIVVILAWCAIRHSTREPDSALLKCQNNGCDSTSCVYYEAYQCSVINLARCKFLLWFHPTRLVSCSRYEGLVWQALIPSLVVHNFNANLMKKLKNFVSLSKNHLKNSLTLLVATCKVRVNYLMFS